MRTGDLLIRCLAMKEGDQWIGICLPFDLAAQADTLPEMKHKLQEQIVHYLHDALTGPDREHAEYLLSQRRAPLKYWVKYYLAGFMGRIHRMRTMRRFKTPVSFEPIAC